MPAASITLDEAVDPARTGEVWLFRGHTIADRAIQVAANSPVNHAGMSVVVGGLPPLMWHAELGRSPARRVVRYPPPRGQLHDLREAVIGWATRYGQRAWLRQLDPAVTREREDAVVRTIARLDGTPFPSTTRLVSRWLAGRAPALRRRARDAGPETAYRAGGVAARGAPRRACRVSRPGRPACRRCSRGAGHGHAETAERVQGRARAAGDRPALSFLT